jgi:undecaprenol kinase
LAVRKNARAVTRFLRSFGYAFDGLVDATRAQPNLTLHWIVAAAVLIAAIALHLALWAFALVVALIALVVSLELLNTALEAWVDLATPMLHPLAKRAKDAGAAAVLVASAGAALCGAAIFTNAAYGGVAAARGAGEPQTALAAAAIAAIAAVLACAGRRRRVL